MKKWKIEYEINMGEWISWFYVTANELHRDKENDKIIIADGVRIEILESIVSIDEI